MTVLFGQLVHMPARFFTRIALAYLLLSYWDRIFQFLRWADMQPTSGTMTDNTNMSDKLFTHVDQGLKKGPSPTVLDGWFALDLETEREIQVEQPQSMQKTFLGPVETMLLAGLIVATLARNLIRGGCETNRHVK